MDDTTEAGTIAARSVSSRPTRRSVSSRRCTLARQPRTWPRWSHCSWTTCRPVTAASGARRAAWLDPILRPYRTTFHIIGNHIIDLVDENHEDGVWCIWPAGARGGRPGGCDDRRADLRAPGRRVAVPQPAARGVDAADVLEHPLRVEDRFHFPDNPMIHRAEFPEKWQTWRDFWSRIRAPSLADPTASVLTGGVLIAAQRPFSVLGDTRPMHEMTAGDSRQEARMSLGTPLDRGAVEATSGRSWTAGWSAPSAGRGCRCRPPRRGCCGSSACGRDREHGRPVRAAGRPDRRGHRHRGSRTSKLLTSEPDPDDEVHSLRLDVAGATSVPVWRGKSTEVLDHALDTLTPQERAAIAIALSPARASRRRGCGANDGQPLAGRGHSRAES